MGSGQRVKSDLSCPLSPNQTARTSYFCDGRRAVVRADAMVESVR